MKDGVKKAIRAVGFMSVLLLLTVSSSYMLAPKDNTKQSGIVNPNAHGFYSEPYGTVDIAVIGNSDAYSGFSPMELWHNYGYTAYVSAEGRQSPAQAYAMLKKIFSSQKPKLVILETDCFFAKSKIVESAAKMVNASLGSSFSVFQYHDRWKRVTPDELLKKPQFTAHCASKGQWLSNKVKGYTGGEYMVKTNECAELPFSTVTSVNAFIKLCRANGAELLFAELPSQSSWSYKRHNAVKKYADKNGIEFIDLNLNRESFGFDWKTDSRDGGNHLNSRGARKCTRYLGEFIKNNYNITDNRGNAKYDRWNKDYGEYTKKVKI